MTRQLHIGPSVAILETLMGAPVIMAAPNTATDGDDWLNTTDGWVYRRANGEWVRRYRVTPINAPS